VKWHELNIDGVRVLHFPSEDRRTSAVLVFAAGSRDETLVTAGSLHALEHLCLDAVRDTPLDINGMVDRLTTQFTVEGPPELVGPWLERLCRSLASPPVEGLEQEAAVLLAEGEGMEADPLLLARFGNRDLGLGAALGPAPGTLSRDQLRADAARWFSRGNAVLAVDGPLPTLTLPLPPGQRLARDWPAPRRAGRAQALVLDVDVVAVNAILPPSGPARLDRLAARLLENRVREEVRHRGRLAYQIDYEAWPLPDRSTVFTVLCEAATGKGATAARVLLEATDSLLRSGPSSTELERARQQLLHDDDGRAAFIDRTVNSAIGTLLFGSPDPEMDVAALLATDVTTVTRYLGDLLDDVLYLVGEDAREVVRDFGLPVGSLEPQLPSLPTSGVVYRPPPLARLVFRGARSVRLLIGEEAIWQQLDGEVTGVRWEDVAGVCARADDRSVVIYGLDGTAIAVDDRFSGTPKIIAEVRTRVPSHKWYEGTPDDDGGFR
jgi:hypothetical protein